MAEMMKKTTKEAKDMISKVNITDQYRFNIKKTPHSTI